MQNLNHEEKSIEKPIEIEGLRFGEYNDTIDVEVGSLATEHSTHT